MPEIGYTLSSEENPPLDLVRHAARAEEVGFSYALISDHFHPWLDSQGHSPFVWAVLGGIADATERLRVGTGVTAPIIRIHPAIVAHAAATVAAMMPGRFFLGVGTGENLNEHIHGDRWPSADLRLEMLEEAIETMRELWGGEMTTRRGRFYTVEQARIYDAPDDPIAIYVAAKGPRAAELAGRLGDGFIGTSPEKEVLEQFDEAGGAGKPKVGQLNVCWATDEDSARKTAHEYWRNGPLPGELSVELPLPRHFEQASELVTPEQMGEGMPVGPDPEQYLKAISDYDQAGYTHVYLHQIGPDQEGFFRFAEQEILPKYS